MSLLKVVKKQIEAEIASDRADIAAILEDPSVIGHIPEKGLAYAIHEKYHHLATHEMILKLIKKDERTYS